VHDLPRKLSVEELARLFEGRTRFVERLADYQDPLGAARALLNELPEDERIEALNAHPRIGAPQLSAVSSREQGTNTDPVVLEELARLNRAYETKFGFRFVVFVNGRSRSEILDVLRGRLGRTKDQEFATALDDLVAIANARSRAG